MLLKKIILWIVTPSLAALLFAPLTHGHVLLMFGDSITQGWQRDSSYNVSGVLSPPNGSRVNGSYGPQLEALLAGEQTSYAYNWGYLGENTSEGLNRIDTALSSRTADYILILEAANDLLQGVSQASSVSNLGYMLDKSIAAGVVPIISELSPMDCPQLCNWDKYIQSINTEIAKLAEEKDVVLCEIHGDMLAAWTSKYTSGDGLHVSDKGYVLMAQKWYVAIQDAITQASKSNQLFGVTHLLLRKK